MVLVDSSVWVEYLRGQPETEELDGLIDEGLVAINEIILAELLPPLIVRRQQKLVELLREVPRLPLNIDWPGVVDDQTRCLRHGIHRVGLPDLLIAQNAMQHAAPLFTRDKHFRLMSRCLPLTVH